MTSFPLEGPESPGRFWKECTMSTYTPADLESKVQKLEERIIELQEKIDLIFGNHVFIDERIVDIENLRGGVWRRK